MSYTLIVLGLIVWVMYCISVVEFALWATKSIAVYVLICLVGIFLVPVFVLDTTIFFTGG